jgi:phage-related protein
MAAVIGALRIDLSASVAQFAADMASAGKTLEAFGKKFKSVAQDLTRLGTTLSIALSAPIIALGVTSSRVATEAAQATGQVEAALKSMGNTSGRSAAQLEASADALAHVSTYTKDDILRNVTAGLLRFGNVQGPIFDRAQKDILDLAARMGIDLPAATSLVGRALQDPIQGLTRLQRSGIQFTEQQKEQIKQLVLSGQGMKAQELILTSLEQRFGGAALALRKATPGADLKESWHDFQETLGKIVNQFLPPLTAFLSQVIDKFQQLPPGVQKATVEIAALAAVIGPLIGIIGFVAEGVATIAESVGGLATLFEGLGTAAGAEGAAGGLSALADAFGPVGIAIGAVIAFVIAFKDKFVAALSDVWNEAVAVLGPAWDQLATSFGNVWTALTTGPLGQALTFILSGLADLLSWLIKVFGSAVVQLLAGFFKFVSDGLNAVADVLNFVGDVLTGNFSKAWQDMGNFVLDVVAGIVRGIATLIPALDGVATKLEEIQNRAHAAQQPPKPGAPPPVLAAPPPTLPPLVHPTFNTGKPARARKDKSADGAAELTSGLGDLGESISNATQQVPEAISKTDEFTKRLQELIDKAIKAKVNMKAFAGTIATLKAEIASYRSTELEREAQKFSKAVDEDTRSVGDFAKGGLDPLTEKLREVDDKYQNLKDTITEQIEANKVLAASNADAAAAMVRLQAQLAALEGAHAAATSAAKAQYLAEERIAQLQAQSTGLKTATEIRDFQASATGQGAPIGAAAQATQKAQDELDQKRLDIETQIATLEEQRDEKLRAGDTAAAARLTANIDLQTKFLGLVNSTTAQQIAGQARINQAWDNFSDNLSTAIQDLGANNKNVGQDLAKTVQGLMHDAIIKPFADQLSGELTKGIKGLFGLGDSSKPTGAANDPFFVTPSSGAAGMLGGATSPGGGLAGVLQNPLGSMTQGLQSLFGAAGAGGSIGSGLSGIASGIGGFFKSFLGGFAGGGKFSSGGWGIIGEKGPELWAPNRTGYVVPQSDLAGGGGMRVTQNWNIATPDAASFGHSQRQLARAASSHLRQLGATS